MSSNLDHSLTLFDVLNCMYQHGSGHSFFKVIVYVIGNYKYAWKFQNERHPKLPTFIINKMTVLLVDRYHLIQRELVQQELMLIYSHP